jgi:hypothetical protein
MVLDITAWQEMKELKCHPEEVIKDFGIGDWEILEFEP